MDISLMEEACSASISDMEAMFHYEHSRSRLDKDQWVYLDDSQLMKELDDFCDIDNMHHKQGPMIIYGEHGSGKSALISNWIAKRKKHAQTWSASFPEFIFYHAVGCTRQSTSVAKLLDRLLSEMKDFFELMKEIPTLEERLSWQFPRFLEAASRKGRVIIAIDGINRLHTSDGEGVIRWIPLSFPANVRLIFTGTVSKSSVLSFSPGGDVVILPRQPIEGDTIKGNEVPQSVIDRVQVEAVRRKWKSVSSQPLTTQQRRSIVLKFLMKQQARSTAQPLKFGLRLFPIQQEAIVQQEQCASPLYLRTLLFGLAWAAEQGFDLHTVFKDWITTKGSPALNEAILRTMEHGFRPSDRIQNNAKAFIMEQGLEDLDIKVNNTSKDTGGYEESQDTQEWDENEKDSSDYGSDSFDDENPQADNADTEFTFVEAEEGDQATIAPKVNATMDGEEVEDGEEEVEQLQDTFHLTGVAHVSPALSKRKSRMSTSDLSIVDDSLKNDNGEDQKIMNQIQFDRFPTYLRGGEHVKGLQGVLASALSLLYVARHGLYEDEFRIILQVLEKDRKHHEAKQAEENEKKKNVSCTKTSKDQPPRRKMSLIPTNIDFDEPIDQKLWLSLTKALKCLGIVFYNDVCIMPLCSDSLRELVWWRYLGSEKIEFRYRQFLVEYFTSQLTSPRRAEELPWHLSTCNQKTTLKDTLVDVSMFRVLFTSSFKAELFAYWQMLCDTSSSATSTSSSTLSLTAKVKTTKDKDAGASRRGVLEDMVKPSSIDIVREYVKSVHDWHHNSRPSNHHLTALVNTISRFLYEYSSFSQQPYPKFDHPPLEMSAIAHEGIEMPEQPQAPVGCEPTSLYLYQRWVWIMFPWIALSNKLVISSRDTESKVKKHPEQVPWADVKAKLEASDQEVSLNEHKLHGRLKAVIPPSKVRRPISDIIGMHSAENQMIRRKTASMTLRQTAETMDRISVSKKPLPGIRHSMSLDKLHEKPAPVQLLSPTPSFIRSQRRSTFVVEAESRPGPPLRSLGSLASDSYGLPAHLQDYSNLPLDVKKSCNQQQLYKIKQTFNALHIELKEKQARLRKLKQTYREKVTQRQIALKKLQDGEAALEAMNNRAQKLDDAMEVIDTQGQLYQRIIKICHDFPAADKTHLLKQKDHIKRLRSELKNQKDELSALTFGTHNLRESKLPVLREELEKSKNLYGKIMENVQSTRERMLEEKKAQTKIINVRESIVEEVRSNIRSLDPEEEKKLSTYLDKQTQVRDKLAQEVELVRTALQQCETQCGKIRNATGLSNLDVIYHKFVNREELNRSLEEQSSSYENRLRLMKLDQQEIEKELNTLQFRQTSANIEDIRVLEEESIHAESKLAQAQAMFAASKLCYKESILGLANVAKLLGIQHAANPRKEILQSSKLWPPSDHRSAIASEIMSASQEQLTEVVGVCEERAIAFMEAALHGRGSPDAGFDIVLKVSPGPRRQMNKLQKAKSISEPSAPTPSDYFSHSSNPAVPLSTIKMKRGMSEFSPDIDDDAGPENEVDVPAHYGSVTDQDEDELEHVLSRENIKVASKKQVNARKRAMNQQSMDSEPPVSTTPSGLLPDE